MNILAIPCSTQYSITLTPKQFDTLSSRNEYNYNLDNGFDIDSIITSLTWGDSIEFNGHFGYNFFFRLHSENSSDSEVIARIVKLYANNKSFEAIFNESLNSSFSEKLNSGFVSKFEYQTQLFK